MVTRWQKLKRSGWRRFWVELSPEEFELLDAERQRMAKRNGLAWHSSSLIEPGNLVRVLVTQVLWDEERERRKLFRAKAHLWFVLRIATIAVVALVAGCGGAGGLPLVGRADLCIEVTEHWEDRAHACGHADWHGKYEKCETAIELFTSTEERAACLADVDGLACDKLLPLPASCSKLFQGGI